MLLSIPLTYIILTSIVEESVIDFHLKLTLMIIMKHKNLTLTWIFNKSICNKYIKLQKPDCTCSQENAHFRFTVQVSKCTLPTWDILQCFHYLGRKMLKAIALAITILLLENKYCKWLTHSLCIGRLGMFFDLHS